MNEGHARRTKSARNRTILASFVAQNLAMGLGFGSFGPLMSINEAHFDISRTFATIGMSMMTVALSLVSPVLGGLLQRSNIRNMMIGAALLNALSYAALGVLTNYYAALLCYAVIGVAIAILAILGPLALVTRWIDSGRGKALALINMPLIMFVTPYAIAMAEPAIGRTSTYMVMAALLLLLIPLLSLVSEGPQANAAAGQHAPLKKAALQPGASPLRSLPFWTVSVGIGILAGSGIVFVVHIVPFGLSHALTLKQAAAILSVYSGAGILGTLLFGWLADRLTPPKALMLATLILSVLWFVLVRITAFDLYLLAAIFIGLCGAPVITLHGAAMSALFGPQGAAHAMGYSYSMKLPFLIGSAPLAGFLFEQNGDYRLAFHFVSAALVVATLLFATVAFWARRIPEKSPLAVVR